MDANGIQMNFQWRPGFAAEKQAGMEKLQFAFSQKAADLIDPNVPFGTGTLKESVNTASDFKNGLLVYNTPYARKQYYLHPKGTDLHGETETRGSYWGQRAIDEHKDELVKFAQKAASAYFGGQE